MFRPTISPYRQAIVVVRLDSCLIKLFPKAVHLAQSILCNTESLRAILKRTACSCSCHPSLDVKTNSAHFNSWIIMSLITILKTRVRALAYREGSRRTPFETQRKSLICSRNVMQCLIYILLTTYSAFLIKANN